MPNNNKQVVLHFPLTTIPPPPPLFFGTFSNSGSSRSSWSILQSDGGKYVYM